MPTYEYLCQTCSHRFETWQKMTDEPLSICPECGGHIRRVFYPAGVVFKGSGFYSTDYNNHKSAATSDNGEAKKAEGATDNKATGENKASESKSSENGSSNHASTGESTSSTTTTK